MDETGAWSCEPFRPRRVAFDGVRDVAGYRLKLYTIVYGDGPFRREAFERGLAVAWGLLPRPARTAGRPGVGFAIAHQGRGADVVVLGWWDRENELPTRILLRDGEAWRPARDGESFCVWDLEVVWHEREAYVATLLAGGVEGAMEAYLARRLPRS